MKRAGWLVGCVGLLIVFLTAPGGAQPPRPPAPPTVHHPDLVVSSFTVNRGRVATGETFTYTIDVKNRGDAPCAAFSLTVTLPRGIASAGPLQGAAPLSCRGLTCKWGGVGIPPLLPDTIVSASVTVKAPAGAGTLTGARATVASSNSTTCPEISGANNATAGPAVTVFARPDLAITQWMCPATAGSGVDISCEVTIANQGAGPANNASLVWTVVSQGSGDLLLGPVSGWEGCVTSPPLVTCGKRTFAPGGGAKVTLKLRTPKYGPVSVQVKVADPDDTNTSNNEKDAQIVIQ